MSKMFNNLSTSGTTVTEKLGLDSEVRELKFGSSFTPGNRGQSGAFHSIKYDFKPASVDKSKSATLEMGPNGQVSISMPHYDNNGSTVFKGSTRPYTKDCVLIIDKDTGEIVLEKLSHNIQVKKTRQEGSGKNSAKHTGDLPQPPPDAGPPRSGFNRNEYSSRGREPEGGFTSKRPIIPQTQTLNPPNSIGSGHGRRPNSPLPPTTGSSRHSPHPSNTNIATGHSPSPSFGESHGGMGKPSSSSATFDAIVSKQAPAMFSLPMLEDLITNTPPPPPVPPSSKKEPNQQKATFSHQHQETNPNPIVKHHSSKNSAEKQTPRQMSDSSDDSSSSSSSDEDDDSSSASDMEEVSLPPSITPMDVCRKPTPTPPPAPFRIPATTSVPGSMPNFFDLADTMPSHLLNEDLQLSESGSDSE